MPAARGPAAIVALLALLGGAAASSALALQPPATPAGPAPQRPGAAIGSPGAKGPAGLPLPPQADAASAARAANLVEQAMRLYDEGAFAQAIEALNAAAKLDGRNAKGLYYLANAYWRLDDFNRATDAFTRLLALDARGPFADDAREWLAAQGSFEILAGRVQVKPLPASPARPAPARVEATMQDGWTRLAAPPGWSKDADEVVKEPAVGQFYRLSFRKDLGGGQTAKLVAEAHHGSADPPPGKTKGGFPGLSETIDRMLADLGVTEYQVTRSKAVDNGQELEFEAVAAPGGPVQGAVRGVRSGPSMLVTVALAPKASWPGVAKQVQPAAASLKTATASERQAGALAGAGGGPTPTPGPSPTPNVPTFYLPKPGDPTLPPGLYPVPWGTPVPTPKPTGSP